MGCRVVFEEKQRRVTFYCTTCRLIFEVVVPEKPPCVLSMLG
jgi:hypothetical protein